MAQSDGCNRFILSHSNELCDVYIKRNISVGVSMRTFEYPGLNIALLLEAIIMSIMINVWQDERRKILS